MYYTSEAVNKMDTSFNCWLSIIIDDITNLFTLNNQKKLLMWTIQANIQKNPVFLFNLLWDIVMIASWIHKAWNGTNNTPGYGWEQEHQWPVLHFLCDLGRKYNMSKYMI